MKKYKVLGKYPNGCYFSPFRKHNYGKDIINKRMVCKNFDKSQERDCSHGFYATDVEGLIYSLRPGRVVFEMDMGGESVIFNEYKQRFSEQTFIREMPPKEVKDLVKEQSEKMAWDYYHAVYPVDPRKIKAQGVSGEVLGLLRELSSARSSAADSVWYTVWESVRGSVADSVRSSVANSVRSSVGGSVRSSVANSARSSVATPVWHTVADSVRYTVWESVWAYIGSLFPNVKKWKGVDHKEGVYPFESGAKLWKMGLVPSFDGAVWRIHAGEDMAVVFEISKEELEAKGGSRGSSIN